MESTEDKSQRISHTKLYIKQKRIPNCISKTKENTRRPQLDLAADPLAQVCHGREKRRAVVCRNTVSHDVRAHVDNVAARTPAQREGVSAHGIYNEVARGRHRAHRREIDGYLRAEPDLQVAHS